MAADAIHASQGTSTDFGLGVILYMDVKEVSVPFSAEKLRKRIDRSGKSISDLAQGIGLPASTIYRLLRPGAHENPTIDLLDRVALGLGCEAKQLLEPARSPDQILLDNGCLARIIDVCAFSRRGTMRGELLRWATNKRGLYILHAVIDSNGRRLPWEDTKRTINQILIRDRGDALKMLRTGRYATRLRNSADAAPSLICPERLMLELDDGTILPLSGEPSIAREIRKDLTNAMLVG